jgi:hypothetical protein
MRRITDRRLTHNLPEANAVWPIPNGGRWSLPAST